MRNLGLSKVIHSVLALSLYANAAEALELGQLTLLSHLNEPLKANVDLGTVDSKDLADLHFSLADQQTYQAQGLTKPFYLNGLKFKLLASRNNQHTVQLSTRERIREPILDLFIRVEGMQGSLTRLYTMMIDPREMAARPSSIRKPLPAVKHNASAPLPAADSQSQSAPVNEKTTAAGSLLVANDSISMIAQKSKLHEKYSVYQIMRAFYLLNSQAFIKGNINFLQSGSRLQVPAESLIAEVARQQAVNFVYSKSSDQASHQASAEASQAPDVEPVTSKPSKPAAQAGSAKAVQPLLQPAPTNQAGSTVSENIKKDIADWRSMTAEFSQLTSLVQSQNHVLETQVKAIRQIDQQQQLDASQLEAVQQRLHKLETARQATTASQSTQPVSVTAGLSDADMPVTREMLQQINLRLQALEQRAQTDARMPMSSIQPSAEIPALEASASKQIQPGVVAKPEQPVPPAADRIPAPAAIITESEKSSLSSGGWWSNKSSLLMAVVSLFAVCLLLVREFSWRSRLRASSKAHPHPVKEMQPASGMEPEVDLETGDASSPAVAQADVELSSEDDADVTLEVEVSSQQVAEEKYQQAVDMAKEYTLEELTVVGDDVEHTQEDEALYAEIDILIAYQLYEEALKMVQTSREKMPTNHCLDIRELEILAYLKEQDLFLAKYDAQKSLLSAEFPQAWEKIEALHDEFDSSYPRAVKL